MSDKLKEVIAKLKSSEESKNAEEKGEEAATAEIPKAEVEQPKPIEATEPKPIDTPEIAAEPSKEEIKPINASVEPSEKEIQMTSQAIVDLQNDGVFRLNLLNGLEEISKNIKRLSDAMEELVK